jgi:hypothetical protein
MAFSDSEYSEIVCSAPRYRRGENLKVSITNSNQSFSLLEQFLTSVSRISTKSIALLRLLSVP